MPILRQIRVDRRDRRCCHLLSHAANVTSQAGEDGIVARIFEIIGPGSKWCVEFGAWDGKQFSNTFDLIQNRGWSGVLIEGSAEKFKDLLETYGNNPKALCINGVVQPAAGPNSLDAFLEQTPIPAENSTCCPSTSMATTIMSGESLSKYRPRVVVVETNPTIPNDIVFVQDRDPRVNQGSSLRAMMELGKLKGYELACATNLNGIFVVQQEYAKLGIPNNDIDAMAFVPFDGKYFQGYDGTLFHVGLSEMRWQSVTIGPEQLQVLEPARRRYKGSLIG